MHKKGLTLVELLGAVVILGIIVSLSAVIISYMNKANALLIDKMHAQTTGMLVIDEIEDQIGQLNVTDYLLTSSTQLTLYSEYDLTYDPDLNDIVTVTYDPAIELSLLITDTLSLNGATIDLDGMTLNSASEITVVTTSEVIQISIDIILDSGFESYPFSTTVIIPVLGGV